MLKFICLARRVIRFARRRESSQKAKADFIALLRAAAGGRLARGEGYGSLALWERWIAKQDGEGVKWSPLVAPPTVELILDGGTWSTARRYKNAEI